MLFESFEKVYNDERVSEIVVSDDHSEKDIYYQLEKLFVHLPKIKMFRNDTNVDCYRNKKISVELATNEWCILFDSDNILDISYLDRIFEIENWQPQTSYMPSLAFPTFNYEKFVGYISPNNVSIYFGQPMFDTMLNCMNFFVNKAEYLKVWDGGVNPHTADSLYFNYCWFKSGNQMYVVPKLSYFHRIHNGSHYKLNNHLTKDLYEKTIEEFKKIS